MSATDTVTAAELRRWARGMYATEAAVELLIRSFDGQFARRGYPWIRRDDDSPARVWLDVERITDDTTGAYSGGERRVLKLVAALLTARSIDLGDVAAGIDRRHLQLALAAIAHAGGSHQHGGFEYDDGGKPIGTVSYDSLYPWPQD